MKKFKLQVDNPCGQKWKNFTPLGDKGFCTQCQKEVVDFTKFSDTEIREYFQKRPKGVCGQFQPNQLKVYNDPNPNKHLSRWLAWPIAATATLFSGNVIIAQETEKIEIIDKKEISFTTSLPNRLIKGTVIDDTGEGLPGVNVIIKGTTTGTMTDLEGRFELEVPKDYSWLIFSSVGMETTEHELSEEEGILLTLPMSYAMLGGVTVGGVMVTKWYTPRGIWSRTRSLFRRIF